jgi:protein NirF
MWPHRQGTSALIAACLLPAAPGVADLRGTGDLGIVIERAAGRAVLVETTTRTALSRFEGLGDLSHASAVFSRDGRHAFVFGRDGGLSKLDLLTGRVIARTVQAGNSIGGAISQDGRLVAVSNYEPGGVRVFDSDTLAPVADIPAIYGEQGERSRVVGLVDAPGRRFVFSLFDAGEIWIADLHDAKSPVIRRIKSVGREPYDGLITPDTRHYIAGLFGEDGVAVVDLWAQEPAARRVLDGYGRGEEPLPVYKMPHLEGWAAAGDYLFVPGVGHHYVLAVDRRTWDEVARIPVRGQPVFAIARPDGRQVWVNFALPDNGVVQVIDVASMEVVKELVPGRAVLHMEFTPRGDEVWISARDDNRVVILDTETFATVAEIAAEQPSGIFLTARANRIGM